MDVFAPVYVPACALAPNHGGKPHKVDLGMDALSVINCVGMGPRVLLGLCRAAYGDESAWMSAAHRAGSGGRTSVMYAAHTNDLDRLAFFINGATPQRLMITDDSGMSAYDHAAKAGHLSACSMLRLATAHCFAQDAELAAAVASVGKTHAGKDAASRALAALCAGARRAESQTPAHLEEVRELLALGANPCMNNIWHAGLECAFATALSCDYMDAVALFAEAPSFNPDARCLDFCLQECVEKCTRSVRARPIGIVRALVERFEPPYASIQNLLLTACYGVSADAVRFFLSKGANANDMMGGYLSPLSLVASYPYECEESARLLLEAGARGVDEAAQRAALKANPRILQLLLEHGFKEDTQAFSMQSLLASAARGAARYDRCGALELAIRAAGGSACSREYASSAFYVLLTGSLTYGPAADNIARAVQCLVDSGLRVPEGEVTDVLHHAVSRPSSLEVLLHAWHPSPADCADALLCSVLDMCVESTKLLLAAGATLIDPRPDAAKSAAVASRFKSLLNVGIQGVDRRERDMAARCAEMVKVLLDAGEHVDGRAGSAEQTPLAHAASFFCTDIVPLLLERGAKVTADALISAIKATDSTTCLEMLLKAPSCDVDAKSLDEYGETALMCAVRYGRYRACALLLSRGASRDAVCKKGRSVLDRLPKHTSLEFFKTSVGW